MHAVEVSHLTKEYRLGAMQSLRQIATSLGGRLTGRTVGQAPLFKALDDVSFTVAPGEVVGIIGHNGAGKSTLLKMLSRISTPTSGSVKVNGRVAPLIEVGAGFVGDFTGRENVYLNGAILGMPKKEIDRKFDEIVDFAEMEEFIDTPVKRYSSGMQMKLAFAVATSMESEILIVDEVLAVGDLAFQRKCFDRMEELIKKQQRTVLLVSHNIRQVERLCDRAVLMQAGRVVRCGPSKSVCEEFFEQSSRKIHSASKEKHDQTPKNRSSQNLVRVIGASILDREGKTQSHFATGTDLNVVLDLYLPRPLKKPVFGLGVHTPDLLYIGAERSEAKLPLDMLAAGKHQISCRMIALPLLPGTYSIRASIVSGDFPAEDFYGENLVSFQITPPTGFSSRDMRGEGRYKAQGAEAEVAAEELMG